MIEEDQKRKEAPMATGLFDYFPDALFEVAHCSWVGSQQHNPGQPIHWDKEKSTSEADSLLRHLVERGKFDIDGVRHSAKVAWRALALLQRELEAERVLVKHIERIADRAPPVCPDVDGDIWCHPPIACGPTKLPEWYDHH